MISNRIYETTSYLFYDMGFNKADKVYGLEKLLTGGTRQHVETRHKIRYDHMTEQIAARLPSLEEAKLLEITSKLTPVLALTVTAFDTAGRPLQVSHLLLPGDRHELEDTYSLI